VRWHLYTNEKSKNRLSLLNRSMLKKIILKFLPQETKIMKLYLFNSKQEKIEVNENTSITRERNSLVQNFSKFLDSNIKSDVFYEQNCKTKD
jgi:hypothetical protein